MNTNSKPARTLTSGNVIAISRLIGRGGEIRTHDPLRPRQVRYQAALRPDNYCSFDSKPLPSVKILLVMPKGLKNAPTVAKP